MRRQHHEQLAVVFLGTNLAAPEMQRHNTHCQFAASLFTHTPHVLHYLPAHHHSVTLPLQTPAFYNFSRLLLKVPEHTWGVDIKKTLADFADYSNPHLHACLSPHLRPAWAPGYKPLITQQPTAAQQPHTGSDSSTVLSSSRGEGEADRGGLGGVQRAPCPNYGHCIKAWNRQAAYVDWALEVGVSSTQGSAGYGSAQFVGCHDCCIVLVVRPSTPQPLCCVSTPLPHLPDLPTTCLPACPSVFPSVSAPCRPCQLTTGWLNPMLLTSACGSSWQQSATSSSSHPPLRCCHCCHQYRSTTCSQTSTLPPALLHQHVASSAACSSGSSSNSMQRYTPLASTCLTSPRLASTNSNSSCPQVTAQVAVEVGALPRPPPDLQRNRQVTSTQHHSSSSSCTPVLLRSLGLLYTSIGVAAGGLNWMRQQVRGVCVCLQLGYVLGMLLVWAHAADVAGVTHSSTVWCQRLSPLACCLCLCIPFALQVPSPPLSSLMMTAQHQGWTGPGAALVAVMQGGCWAS